MSDIRYISLDFQNGYSYRRCNLPLDQQGLVLIRGLNLDDGGYLGAGKTSPWEVFSFLQTGRVGKQRKGERHLADDVVNIHENQDFEARLRLELNGKEFEIVQHRRHHKWGNGYRVVDVDAGRNIVPNAVRNHPQNWVSRQLLGLDEKSFFNLVYLAQDFSNVMLTGTDGDRQQSLVQMFDLDVYDELLKMTKLQIGAYTRVLTDVDVLSRELVEVEEQLKQQTAPLDSLVRSVAVKRADLLQAQRDHDTSVSSLGQIQDLLGKVSARAQHKKELKRLWQQVDVLIAPKPSTVTKKLCQKVQRKADALATDVAGLRNSLRLLDQRTIIEKRLDTLVARDEQEVQAELEVVKEDLRVLTNDTLPKAERRAEIVADLRKLQRPSLSVEDLREKLDQGKETKQKLEIDLKAITSKLNKGICPTCLRPLDMDQQEVQESKKRQSGLRKRLDKVSADVHEFSIMLTSAQRYGELKESLRQTGNVADPVSVQKEIRRLSADEKRLTTDLESGRLRATLQQQLDSLPSVSSKSLSEKIQAKEQKVEHYRCQYDVLSSLLREMILLRRLPKGDVKDLKNRVRTANATIKNSVDAISVLTLEIATMEQTIGKIQELESRRKKIRKGLKETKTAQKSVTCLRALEHCFGSKGLKKVRLRAILQDAMEKTIPRYMRLLWPKREVQVQLVENADAVRVELTRDQDVQLGSRLLSGGERNKLGLAMLFGMRDLKQKYTGLKTNVLVVDEPFGNLDQHGTENLLQVLQVLKRRFGSVFVIGNQSDVLDSRVWDQTWWVVREQNESVLYRDGLPGHYNAA